jgi:hypothetical protein
MTTSTDRTFVPFNLNDLMRVKLTEAGVKQWHQFRESYGVSHSQSEFDSHITPDGWYESQAHDIISIWGSMIGMGAGPLPFETTVVVEPYTGPIEKPTRWQPAQRTVRLQAGPCHSQSLTIPSHWKHFGRHSLSGKFPKPAIYDVHADGEIAHFIGYADCVSSGEPRRVPITTPMHLVRRAEALMEKLGDRRGISFDNMDDDVLDDILLEIIEALNDEHE